MAEFPALPLFTDAYLGDTRHLSTIEHGAYLLLLIVAWRSKETCLPDDDAKLAKYVGMTRGQWARISPTIREFFTANNGSLYQSRLTDEANRVRQVRDSQAAAGRASALKRNGRHSTERIAKREQSDMLSTNQNPTPSPIPIPTIIEPKGSSPQQAADAAEQVRMDDVLAAWDDLAVRCGLPRIRGKLNASRRVKLAARIREHPFEHWVDALNAIERAKWMHGDNARGWRADFDFLLQPGSFQRLIEGTYDRPN